MAAVAPESKRGDYSANPKITLTVPVECNGLRLDQALAQMLTQHSRSRLQNWLRAGRVSVGDRVIVEQRHKVWTGERIELVEGFDEHAEEASPEDIPLRIVHEDDALLVIDKPAGLVVHPGNGNWHGTLLNALLHYAPQLASVPRAGIVHRLDKDTSGLLVVAKTLVAQTHLVRQLQARSVKRIYLALVRGIVERDGMVDAPIGRHPTQRTRMAVIPAGKPARTRYRIIESFQATTLLECALETGRTHQIRVHLDSVGHPLVGDPVYGHRSSRTPRSSSFPHQALHACRLALIHPETGKSLLWRSPLPPAMAALIDEQRRQSVQKEAGAIDDSDNDDAFDDLEDSDVEVIYVTDDFDDDDSSEQ
ncbi:MAG TPA: 23S rRNA pseudouridine(1911/1915/1917) synthase RluD [Accumulibacter sp.]|nr:23S rRNA pseudouridine(1911/1915/1917) synthase RluD [Accumulibacter sp.]HMW18628.1 23S rRNA pseudouridine(1911/1915/1917) synthase RluD [Accumulibacter sp.]HMX22119.1 23S rRNA pseudouridine(1911/1915/1917) synthase RluD [Accumulibacter sp.]HNC18676.1 23S rRNA pseudouridine(1911/1915/1917) synthase RluD [Accumulibacter sp.]HND81247.1 23S rRNA pseudouridine(1911/1915/1917) synthase RluD [Accumulibacter sp.]